MAEKPNIFEAPSIDALSIVHAGGRWLDGCNRSFGALSGELMEFGLRRMQEEARAWTAIVSGAKPGELFDLQRQFAQKAVADYMEEAGKLSRLVTQIAADNLKNSLPPVQAEPPLRAAE